MTDDKLKFYFNELWRRYQESKRIREKNIGKNGYLYIAGECAGLDFAIETLKTVFEIAEKERSEEWPHRKKRLLGISIQRRSR